MSDYNLTMDENTVLRAVDVTFIPNDPANKDWIEYQRWLAAGGVPDPYVPPAPMPPLPETTVLYDHENRIRAIEGQPPLTLGEFIAKASG